MKRVFAALLALGLSAGPAHAGEMASGDARVGRQVFDAYCAKCHSFDPAETAKRGPHLAGLLQRRYGAVAGFAYRMVWPLADPLWTPEHLDTYLEIHRLAEPGPRADLIAFLAAATQGAPMDAALGDAAAGETLFNSKCAYCHSLVREAASRTPADGRYEEITRALERHPWEPPGATPGPATVTERVRRGPHLAGLMARAPGAAEGFPYRFVYEVSGPTWNAPELDAYIAFHARLEPIERADLVAFLSKSTR